MSNASKKMWGTEKIQTIKQKNGSKDCLACVAAMITGTTVNAFKTYCRSHELCLWDDASLFAYMRPFGVLPGIAFNDETFDKSSGVYLFSGPCYLVVESDCQTTRKAGATHAVLWDGKMVHDPAPSMNNKPLEDYVVKMAFPLTRVTEQGKCDCGCGSILFKQAQRVNL